MIFQSGKILSINQELIGINDKSNCVTEGYDEYLLDLTDDYNEPILTPSECVELADEMIRRWQTFKAKFSGRD